MAHKAAIWTQGSLRAKLVHTYHETISTVLGTGVSTENKTDLVSGPKRLTDPHTKCFCMEREKSVGEGRGNTERKASTKSTRAPGNLRGRNLAFQSRRRQLQTSSYIS